MNLDLDEASRHLLLTPTQQEGAAVVVGPGRAAVEALLELGFAPRSLKAWQELFTYADMHGADGLNDLAEYVRLRGGVSSGSYAAALLAQGVEVGPALKVLRAHGQRLELR